MPSALLFSWLLMLGSAVLPALVSGQPARPNMLDPNLQITQYVHRYWQIEEGLPQNSVYAIAQTSDGFLWVGTQEGLARFDGVYFTVFDKSNSPALRSNEIRTLMEDTRGRLWIGTYGGGLVAYENGGFTRYTTFDGLSSASVLALHEDPDGILWIGTDKGLSRFDGASFVTFEMDDGLPSDVVVSFADGQDGTLWVGTIGGGLARLENGKVTSSMRWRTELGRNIYALLRADDDTLWIGTEKGLIRMTSDRIETYASTDGLCADAVLALLQDSEGALWIGSYGGGLCRYYDGQFASFARAEGLTNDVVSALYQDREGSLWVGTDGGGLNQLYAGKFLPYTSSEGLSSDMAIVVTEDANGTLWIGTEGGGLNRLDSDGTVSSALARQLPSPSVSALHAGGRGHLWIGTQQGGFCRYGRGELSCFSREDGLSSDNVYAIYEDAAGHVWIGTDAGLNRYSAGQFRVYTTDDGLSSDLITAIHEDHDGNLWIGTYGGGLNRLRGDEIRHYSTADGLSNNVILTLYEDSEATLWIGTFGGGLCNHKAGRFTCYSTDDGLYSDNVLQILEDDQGHLWLGSNKGLSRISKDELIAYGSGQVRSIRPVVYGTADGLKSSEMNGGAQPSAWRSRDGRLWFATIRGIAAIDPAHIPENPLPPPVIVERFLVNREPVPNEGMLTLPAGSRDFEFHYTGLSFIAPKEVRFQYMLHPYESQWVEAGTRREAFYTNLPPGRYEFRVRACNNDGVWNAAGATVSFIVEPFFYQTTWFLVLCVLGAVVSIVAVHRLRIRALKARERTLEHLVDAQTRELRLQKQQLESLNRNLEREVQTQVAQKLEERRRYEQELIEAKEQAEESARLKSTILSNMSHEIRTPITSILGFAEILSGELEGQHREFVDYIRENGRRLMETLNSILDLSKIETNGAELALQAVDLREAARQSVALLKPMATKKSLSIRTQVPDYPVVADVDPTALDRILYNLVGNAIKFTEKGEVVVNVGATDDAARISVRDTGIGISEAFKPHVFEEFKQESSGIARTHEGNGLGLAITRRLVESMRGEITVESTKGAGSVFTVTFPRSTLSGGADTPSPASARRSSEE